MVLVRRPKTQAVAGCGASRAPGALIGGGSADFFDQQGVDAAIRIVTGNSRQAAVDHETHAVNGERSFGDIGGDHDLAPVIARDGGVLILRRELAVQWKNGKLRAESG